MIFTFSFSGSGLGLLELAAELDLDENGDELREDKPEPEERLEKLLDLDDHEDDLDLLLGDEPSFLSPISSWLLRAANNVFNLDKSCSCCFSAEGLPPTG